MNRRTRTQTTRAAVAAVFLLTASVLAYTQTIVRPAQISSWTKLTNAFPGQQPGTSLLLTDGSVFVHDSCTPNWYKLAPDNTGNYVNGTWSSAVSMQSGHGPVYFASAVLADGRVIAIGGEYNVQDSCANEVWTSLGDVYDPKTNTWSVLQPPAMAEVGDAQSVVLPNGKFLLATNVYSKAIAQLDPATLSWSSVAVTGKVDGNNEEGWTLLPSGKILTVDATLGGTQSEIYDPTTGIWGSAGSTVVSLPGSGKEIGPAVLRPDGTVFATGATGHNSVYTISTGTWAAGPDFPVVDNVQLLAADAPAALLPSGNVLVLASPYFSKPAHAFEFDGRTMTSVAEPPNLANEPSFEARLLLLPTGQALFTDGSRDIEIYTPATTAPGSSAWRPTVSTASIPAVLAPGTTYKISGTQFNGLSQAVAYGDDSQAATNYPLVRITNNGTGHVFYARTHDHSTMGVATGAASVSTSFDTPSKLEPGASTLEVVANGIASIGVPITVQGGAKPTTLTFVSPNATTAALGEAAGVRAKLTVTSGGSAVGGKKVNFVLGAVSDGVTCSATTDVTGVAQCAVTPKQQPGAYTLSAAFAGDASFGGSSASVPFSITPALAITAPTSLGAATVGAAYPATTFHAVGGTGGTAYKWSATGLPPDLTLDASGNLKGTPSTATGSPFTVTVKVSDGVSSVTKVYSLTVSGSGVQVVSVSPNTGGGIGPQTFEVLATDSSGYKDLDWVQLDFGSPSASCFMWYQQSANAVYLYNDTGQILGPIAPKSQQSNSQCTVFGTGSGVNAVKTGGNNLTVSFSVSFKAGFAGVRNIWADAQSYRGANSAWQLLGSWTIPGQTLGVTSVSSSGLNPTTFSVVASDPKGAADLTVVFLQFGSSQGAPHSCFAMYAPQSGQMYLFTDDNSNRLGPISSTGPVSNSQCTLSSGGAAIPNGNDLKVPFKIQFLPGFTGTKSIFAYAQSASGDSGGWQLFGSWMIP